MSAPAYHDAHLHLQDGIFERDLASVLETCANERIEHFVVNGTSESDWEAVEDLARQYPARIIPSFGLHPWHVGAASAHWLEMLEQKLDAIPSGVGEAGLDRWIDGHDIGKQEDAFRCQIRLAAVRNVPLSIHCLKAWGRMLEVLRSEELPACGFLLHSYGGSLEMVPQFRELGAYYSFSGYYLAERKRDRQEALKRIPRDRLLIETDAPDMLPPDAYVRHPLSRPAGKAANHPANLRAIYEGAARTLGLPRAELAEQVSTNFQSLFGSLL